MTDSSASPHLQSPHLQYMQVALDLAKQAAQQGEVPVGAIVVHQHQIIGRGFNQVITHQDPTAHAEVIALRQAAQYMGNYRLPDCHLYISLEPCAMCSGAIFNARIAQVFYAASDAKSGVAHSVLSLFEVPQLNPHCTIKGGLLAAESASLLRDFFMLRRL